MSGKRVPSMAPVMTVDHDRERYKIEVELPGVSRDGIDLEVSETTMCVKAGRGDAEFSGCYFLPHPADIEGVDAAYEDGVLYVSIPFKFPIRGRRIDVKEGGLDLREEDEERRIDGIQPYI